MEFASFQIFGDVIFLLIGVRGFEWIREREVANPLHIMHKLDSFSSADT